MGHVRVGERLNSRYGSCRALYCHEDANPLRTPLFRAGSRVRRKSFQLRQRRGCRLVVNRQWRHCRRRHHREDGEHRHERGQRRRCRNGRSRGARGYRRRGRWRRLESVQRSGPVHRGAHRLLRSLRNAATRQFRRRQPAALGFVPRGNLSGAGPLLGMCDGPEPLHRRALRWHALPGLRSSLDSGVLEVRGRQRLSLAQRSRLLRVRIVGRVDGGQRRGSTSAERRAVRAEHGMCRLPSASPAGHDGRLHWRSLRSRDGRWRQLHARSARRLLLHRFTMHGALLRRDMCGRIGGSVQVDASPGTGSVLGRQGLLGRAALQRSAPLSLRGGVPSRG